MQTRVLPACIPPAALALLTTLGCGGNGIPIVPVKGTVTFAGGECPADGRLTFKPIELESGCPNRVGTAQFQTDGRFSVTTFSAGDGLMPGRYKVEVRCLSGSPDFSKPDPLAAVSYIGRDYQPDDVTVRKGEPLNLRFDLPPSSGDR